MRILGLAACVLALTLFLGMGVAGNDNQLKVPTPDKNFFVVLTDQDDVSTPVNKFSCEGQTYFLGRRGRTQMAVDFSKIGSVRFLMVQGNVRGEFTMRDGEKVTLFMHPEEACHGVSRFGNVRIQIKDLKSVEIRTPRPAP